MQLPAFLTGNKAAAARNDANPFTTLQREIDRVFADFTRGWPALSGADVFSIQMDVTEKDGVVTISAELPGLEEKDVEVVFADNVLTLRGEKKNEREEKNEDRHLIERSYGAFARSIELPAGVKAEDIKAEMDKGILTVTFPRPAQPKPEQKKIAIQAAT